MLKEDAYIRKVREVIRILDGDTVELCVDLGNNTYNISNFRLAGFDAPETWRPSSDEELEAGRKVTKYLESIIDPYRNSIYIQMSKDPQIYGRYVGTLFANDDVYESAININHMVEKFMEGNSLTKEQLKCYTEKRF